MIRTNKQQNHKFQNFKTSLHDTRCSSSQEIDFFLQHAWPKNEIKISNHQCNYYYDGPVSRQTTHLISNAFCLTLSLSQAITLDFTLTGRHHENSFLPKWIFNFIQHCFTWVKQIKYEMTPKVTHWPFH